MFGGRWAAGQIEHSGLVGLMGMQGILVEVTADAREVWRWINPVASLAQPDNRSPHFSVVRQGEQRVAGQYWLYRAFRCVWLLLLDDAVGQVSPGIPCIQG